MVLYNLEKTKRVYALRVDPLARGDLPAAAAGTHVMEQKHMQQQQLRKQQAAGCLYSSSTSNERTED